jgi:hypothetical protein
MFRDDRTSLEADERMIRTRRTRLPAALLLAIFAWGGQGVGVIDAMMFHRMALAAGRGELPSVGDASGLAGHAAACVLEQPLPVARVAPPPCAARLSVSESFRAPIPGGDLTPRQVLQVASLRSRAPPSVPA